MSISPTPRDGNRGTCSNWGIEGNCDKSSFDTLCPSCQHEVRIFRYGRLFDEPRKPPVPTPQHYVEWEQPCEHHDGLCRLSKGNQPRPPKPLAVEEAARILATMLHPDFRALFVEVLMLLVGPRIHAAMKRVAALVGRGGK